jgi:hypothetical protein
MLENGKAASGRLSASRVSNVSRDYSATPLPKKLGITEGSRVALVGAPKGFGARVGVERNARGAADVIVLFTTRRADLVRRFASLAARLEPTGGLWVAWPKKSAKVASDLSFEDVQRVGLEAGLVDNKSCAVDDTWQGLRFVIRCEDRPARAGARRTGARSARPRA